MLRRIRLIATAAAGIMVVVFVVVTLATHRGATPASNAMVPAPLAVGNAVAKPRPLPRVPLVDVRGQRRSLQSFRGKWVIFAPSMTLCHEVCPMTTGVLMELGRLIERAGLSSHVVVAEVTVDPWRDRPARLRAYKRMTGARFKYLTGSVANVMKLWRALGILVERVPLEHPVPIDWYTHRPETLNIVHSDGLFILDPAGQLRISVGGMAKMGAGGLEPALRKLLDREGVHNLHHPEAPYTARQLLEDIDWAMGREVPASWLHPAHAPNALEASRELRGAPHPLASLHDQAGRLLGSVGALQARLRSLRGYPVVLNAWASWCPPCRAEFPVFASASAAFGRDVAFLGIDVEDEAGAARSFLKAHHVSYPSYRGTYADLSAVAPIKATPTTIFLDRRGRVVYVHAGQYQTQSALNADIERYALAQRDAIVGHKVHGG